MRQIHCGIIGFGFMGPQHAEAMRRLGFVHIGAICAADPHAARQKAALLGIPKVYDRYEEMLDDPAIEVVDIVTPTRLHHSIAIAAIAHGKHVIVDKPLALSLDQAREMRDAALAAGVVNAVTFNYRYHPLVQQARFMIRNGDVGPIHLVHGHYLQEWLLHESDFSWRLDPAESGPSAIVGDAGCHWFDLVEHVTGLRISSVLADLRTVIPTREKPLRPRQAFAEASTEATEPYTVSVPDLGAMLLRLNNGGTASFLASPLCAGHKNDLQFAIHGSKLSLAWQQEDPNHLYIGKRGQPDQVLNRDPALLAPEVRRFTSLPGGHSEGWPDAFRNTLFNIFEFISGNGNPLSAVNVPFPTFADGCRALAISEAMVRSSVVGGVWTDVEP